MSKDSTGKLRDFIKGLMTNEMETSELQKCQEMLGELDSIDSNEEQYKQDLTDCKDQIVKLVKSQGTSNTPKDEIGEPQPRSLEDIAKSVINGGK